MTPRIRFVVETVEDCGKTVHGSFTGLINSMASLSRRCRAFRTVARHPHRHTVDHGTLVAGSQVPGLSPTFSGKRPLLQNFPSRKERKVVSFLEGKLNPTPSPRPLSHNGQFCDPIFNAQQSNTGRQQNMGIGRWSRVEPPRNKFPGISVDSNRFNCLGEKSGLGV